MRSDLPFEGIPARAIAAKLVQTLRGRGCCLLQELEPKKMKWSPSC
jgi:hypothetical protein